MDRASVLFYGLALAFALAVALAAPRLGEAVLLITMFTPMLAVLIVKLFFLRDIGSRAGWSELGLHRGGFRYWPLAICLGFVAVASGYLFLAAFGWARLISPPLADIPRLAIQLSASLLIGAVLGALGEEIGWRGFLLPRLLPMGAFRASLLVGLLQGLWHLPLILLTPNYHSGFGWIVVPLFVAALTFSGPVFGYLRIVSASVWPAAILHRSVNLFWDRFDDATEGGDPLVRESIAGESGLAMIVCLVVICWLLWRKAPKSPAAA